MYPHRFPGNSSRIPWVSERHILGSTELDDWAIFIRKVIRTELKTTHVEIKLQTRKKERKKYRETEKDYNI